VQRYFWGVGLALEIVTCMVMIDGLRRIRAALGPQMFDQTHFNIGTILTIIVTIVLFVAICGVELHFKVNDFEALSIWVQIP
jgi:hypothetical protein